MARPTYTCDSTRRCSEVGAGTAAALASSSLVLRGSDPAYADGLLAEARKLYEWADTYQGNNGYTEANGFYPSYSGYEDELAWAATWLYLAIGEATYLSDAEAHISDADNNAAAWAISWDNTSTATNLLLSRITGNAIYENRLRDHMTFMMNGANKLTQGGLSVVDIWGSLRYSSNGAMAALIFANDIKDGGDLVAADQYREWALSRSTTHSGRTRGTRATSSATATMLRKTRTIVGRTTRRRTTSGCRSSTSSS